jgi:hypothetical protein
VEKLYQQQLSLFVLLANKLLQALGSVALGAGAKIGTTRFASQVSRESGTDLNAFLKDGMV